MVSNGLRGGSDEQPPQPSSALTPGSLSPPADSHGHPGPHHEDTTSGAESCRHARPARRCPAAAPAHRRYGNHSYHQTRRAECSHQPAGGQQADQPELGARAAGVQERHGGKSPPLPPISPWTIIIITFL